MFKQEVINQVTNDSNLVNISTKENLDIKMWKYQNIKEFNRTIESDKKNTLQAIVELPQFEMHVRKHEMLWRKPRSEFNALEKEYIDRTYHNMTN